VHREWIYSTELFRSKYEARARDNLSRSLARL
jgi:predicted metal-dependent HD superfamily phosphohydrolase